MHFRPRPVPLRRESRTRARRPTGSPEARARARTDPVYALDASEQAERVGRNEHLPNARGGSCNRSVMIAKCVRHLGIRSHGAHPTQHSAGRFAYDTGPSSKGVGQSWIDACGSARETRAKRRCTIVKATQRRTRVDHLSEFPEARAKWN